MNDMNTQPPEWAMEAENAVLEHFGKWLVTKKFGSGEIAAIISKYAQQPLPLSGETPRDGHWLDQWGACKVCGGEIPHGHANNCDMFKLEMQVTTERTARELVEDTSRKMSFENATLHLRVVAAESKSGDVAKLREALEEVVGCFDAAFTEGLNERLAEQSDDTNPASIRNLVIRRLLYAFEPARAALASVPANPPQVDATLERIARELRRIGDAQDLLGNRVTAKKCFELAQAISAHARQSQPGVRLKRDGLLPCPFCGGEVCRDYVNDSYTEDISCGNCGMSFRISNEDLNTRAESAAPGENLESRQQKSAHALAMLALQSDRYRDDSDYRNAVDNVLSWSMDSQFDDARKTEGAK